MLISFSPIRSDETLTLSVEGEVLILNGDRLDLSGLPEGALLPPAAIASDWIAGPVERAGGELHVPLRLPLGPDAPEAHRFPAPVTATAGPVALPTEEEPS